MDSSNIEKLITLYLINSSELSVQQLEELSNWIEESRENAVYFAKAAYLHRNIHDCLCSSAIAKGLEDTAGFACENNNTEKAGQSELDKIARSEEKQPPLPKKSQNSRQINFKKPEPHKTERRYSKGLLAFAVSGVAAILFLVIYANFIPVQAGKLTQTHNVHFSDDTKIGENNEIYADRYVRIFEGIAEFEFISGTRAVVEGPAEVRLTGKNSAFLSYGKFFAQVPERASGFKVQTQNCDVVDIGTEFGVETGIDGQTTVQMIKGSAQVSSSQIQQSISGTAARSLDKKGEISSTDPDTSKFARKINIGSLGVWRGQSISIADLVCGGDGFGSGKRSSLLPLKDDWKQKIEAGDVSKVQRMPYQVFKQVPGNEYIDCIFSSNGESESIKITSNGLETKALRLSQGDSFWGIAAGREGSNLPVQFNKNFFTVENEEVVVFTANLGFTLDLRRIRNTVRPLKLDGFKSGFDINPGSEAYESKLDVFVLFDGEPAFSKMEIVPEDKQFELDITIPEDARYLTLALCDGGNSNGGDNGVFMNPEIELKFE
ncbi:FecR domain-containing protein [Sedimentisphaera salicampi]|uniref:FecR domain-containing protein n=1 Tax=Sedimentisphaera salicampi TaxID=1941349 RepID=UPI000B9C2C02|nr:FecR domain-containing protein [Sedimentisphaera salicampi]OXU15414.1 FecR protein [Sedimentisphaera salicampi]